MGTASTLGLPAADALAGDVQLVGDLAWERPWADNPGGAFPVRLSCNPLL